MNDYYVVLLGKYNQTDKQVGPEKFSMMLFRELQKRKINVTFIEFITLFNSKSFFQRICGFKKITKNVLKLGIIPFLFFIIKNRKSIYHICIFDKPQIVLLMLKKILKLKLVVTFHSCFSTEVEYSHIREKRIQRFFYMQLELKSIKYSDIRVFVSKLLLNEFKNKNYRLPETGNVVIYNGLDDEFRYNNDISKKNNSELKVVFYNGVRNYLDRGFYEIYQTLKKNDKVKLKIFIIGDFIVNLKSTENIKISHIPLMPKEELIKFLKDKHIVLKGPKFDSFSFFVIECMSLGLIPIVHSKVGAAEFIENGYNGFIYDLDNLEIINEILNHLYFNIELFIFCSRNAQSIKNKFNWESCANLYANLYHSLIS